MKTSHRSHTAIHRPPLSIRVRNSHLAGTAASLLAGVLFASQSALAATIYWDGTATGWDSTANWSTSQTAATPDPASVPGSADIATFVATTATTAQTVNLNGTQSALGLATNASNTFLTTLLGGGTNQTLNLGASGISHLGGGLTIGSATAGQQVAISLQGAQSWTNSAAGTGAAGLQIINGVSIGAGGNQTLTLTGTNTSPNNGVVSGAISDGAAVLSITKSASGTWTFTGANSYTGTTTISAGTLNIQHNTALGTTAGGTSIASNASLQLQGGITVTGETLTLLGNGVSNAGALRSISGNNTWTGNVTVSASSTTRIASDAGLLTISGNVAASPTNADQLVLQGNGNGSITGNISGASKVTKSSTGSGTWTLSGVNTYTGTTIISAAILQFGKTASLYNGDTTKWVATSSSSNASGLNVASNATLSLNVGGTGEFSASDITTLLDASHLGASTGTTGLLGGANLGLDTSNAPGGVFTYAGVIVNPNAGTNALGLTKLGTNTLELTGANTYTGATKISSGTVSAANIVVTGGASNLGNAASAVVLGTTGSTKGTLSYTGSSDTYTRGFSVNSGGGEVDVTTSGQTLTIATGAIAIASTGTFTVGGAGNANITSVISGAGGVVKSDAGTLTLNGTNTYTGTTSIKGGTAVVSGSLSGSSAITIGDSANLGTSAIFGGGGTVGNVTVGAAAGNSGAKLNPHAGSTSTSAGVVLNTGSVTFADSSVHLSLQVGRTSAFITGGGNGSDGGDVSDHVSAAGAVSLNGADLQLSLLTTTGYTIAPDDVLFLIINGSGSAVSGTFASLNGAPTTLSEGSQFTFNSQLYAITYQASFAGNSFTGGNDVALMAVVPEPATAMSLLGGLGVLFVFRRRPVHSRH